MNWSFNLWVLLAESLGRKAILGKGTSLSIDAQRRHDVCWEMSGSSSESTGGCGTRGASGHIMEDLES